MQGYYLHGLSPEPGEETTAKSASKVGKKLSYLELKSKRLIKSFTMYRQASAAALLLVSSNAALYNDFIFFSNTLTFFSKWLVFSPNSGTGHVLIALILTPAAWHMVQHCFGPFGPVEYQQISSNY